MEGQALIADLTKTIEYFKLNESARGKHINDFIYSFNSDREHVANTEQGAKHYAMSLRRCTS